MKKFELYLLFTSLVMGIVILIVVIYHYVKPNNTDLFITNHDENQYEQKNNAKTNDQSWLSVLNSKKNEKSYPKEIFKIEF